MNNIIVNENVGARQHCKKQTSKNIHTYIHILLASLGYPKHLILRYHNFILFAK